MTVSSPCCLGIGKRRYRSKGTSNRGGYGPLTKIRGPPLRALSWRPCSPSGSQAMRPATVFRETDRISQICSMVCPLWLTRMSWARRRSAGFSAYRLLPIKVSCSAVLRERTKRYLVCTSWCCGAGKIEGHYAQKLMFCHLTRPIASVSIITVTEKGDTGDQRLLSGRAREYLGIGLMDSGYR